MTDGPVGELLLEAGTAADAPCEPRSAPRPRRLRFFRVSVRGLLLLIVVIACGLGWIARVVRTGQIQRHAVSAIYRAGGWVVYDTDWDEVQNTSTWKPRWPKWLVDRVGVDFCASVVFINLHDRGTDQVLADVARLRHLKQLHRPGFAVTDVGLAHLRGLTELELLSLDRTQVTDAGLAQLKGLRGLKWLKITRTRVTDLGVAHLQSFLPRLQVLR
jgi:hypothetical protein